MTGTPDTLEPKQVVKVSGVNLDSPGPSEGWPWFSLLLGIPALIAWIAYFAAWLLEPRLAREVDPLQWAGAAAAFWYLIIAVICVGPLAAM